MLRPKEILAPKNFGSKNFGSIHVLGKKNILVKNNFGATKFWVDKNLGQEKFWFVLG